MQAILVRVGIDQGCGEWNAPADLESGEFVYVPIPEGFKSQFAEGTARSFAEIEPLLREFYSRRKLDFTSNSSFPTQLLERSMHLDPDFCHLTYGDDGAARGSDIKKLNPGDLVVFYAGLRPLQKSKNRLVYSIIGLYVVDRIMKAVSVEASSRHLNAHTRKLDICETDIVVHAIREFSGRLRRHIPIGEFRDGSYRVRLDLLDAWGGLSVTNGYIQRSGRPPRFNDAQKFYRWFNERGPELIASNNA